MGYYGAPFGAESRSRNPQIAKTSNEVMEMNVRNIALGAYAGLAVGVVFGIMMGMMGTLPMIGKMVGHPSAVTGFIVHLVNSAIIGGGFAMVFGQAVNGIGSGLGKGLLYGGA